MDWRRWQTLKADIFRDGPPIDLHLRLTDAHQKRHWVWQKRVSPGANTVEYDIPSLHDKIDLSSVTEMMWVAEQPSGTIYLDNVRLHR